MIRTIGLVTTSRADLSPLRAVMSALAAHPALRLEIYVTGMHLAAGFESSLTDLERLGFSPALTVPTIEGDGALSMSQAISKGVAGFAAHFAQFPPDILLVLGDRYDMMPAVLAALPFRLPVAHIHGGEITEGAIDDCIRHAVSKMAHLHFVATETFGKRLCAMGEEPWRVTVCGAPGLDNLLAAPIFDRQELQRRLGIPADARYSLATIHPEMLALIDPRRQGEIFAQAAQEMAGFLILTAPNADAGHGDIRAVLEPLANSRAQTLWLEGAGPQVYPSLLRHAQCVIGNSSSGVIEAGFFRRPVVNIGTRQSGRPMGDNVVQVDWSADSIVEAWKWALSPEAEAKASVSVHPYGQGGAATTIADRLAEVPLGLELVRKVFVDNWV